MPARRLAIAAVFAALFCAPVAGAKSAKEIFAEAAGGVIVVITESAGGEQIGQGGGVVVGANEAATNCHVVEGAAKIVAHQAAGGRGSETYKMEAEIIARDEERDLCLLYIPDLSKPPAAPPVEMGAAKSLTVGEEVFAIGAPQGFELSLSRGIVSQLRGDYGKDAAPYIQTDAAISPGSSGGGLFNENGELVGITTFKHTGQGAEGLTFALPVEWIEELRGKKVDGKRQDEEQKRRLQEAMRKDEEEEKRRAAERRRAAEAAAEQQRAEQEAAEAAQLAALRADLREKYISRIGRRIEDYLRTPPGTAASAEVRLIVRLHPDGELAAVPQIAAASGFADYDEEAVRAVLKSAPLPMPRDDPKLLTEFTVITLNIRPPQ